MFAKLWIKEKRVFSLCRMCTIRNIYIPFIGKFLEDVQLPAKGHL